MTYTTLINDYSLVYKSDATRLFNALYNFNNTWTDVDASIRAGYNERTIKSMAELFDDICHEGKWDALDALTWPDQIDPSEDHGKDLCWLKTSDIKNLLNILFQNCNHPGWDASRGYTLNDLAVIVEGLHLEENGSCDHSTSNLQYDSTHHWWECDCGNYTTGYSSHDYVLDGYYNVCSTCGYTEHSGLGGNYGSVTSGSKYWISNDTYTTLYLDVNGSTESYSLNGEGSGTWSGSSCSNFFSFDLSFQYDYNTLKVSVNSLSWSDYMSFPMSYVDVYIYPNGGENDKLHINIPLSFTLG